MTLMQTLQMILAERPEVSKLVYEKYPGTKLEKTCAVEKNRMDGLRLQMAKRLLSLAKEKKEYGK